MAFKFYQNTTKMIGHQTMFDDVWSPNISHLKEKKRKWEINKLTPKSENKWN